MSLSPEDINYIKETAKNRLGLIVKYFIHAYKNGNENRAPLTEDEKELLKGYAEKIQEDILRDIERYFNKAS